MKEYKMKKIGVKCDKSETSQRVKTIVELKLEGRTRSYILEYAVKAWDISESRVDQLIAMATKQIKEINQASSEESVGVVISNLWTLYRACMSSDNISEANKILMNIAKIKGLDQITIVLEDKREYQDLTDEELEAALVQ